MDDTRLFKQRLDKTIGDIALLDLSKSADILGLQKRDNALVFDFFDRQIRFESMAFSDTENRPLTDAVKWVLCIYLLNCPKKIIETSHRLVSFREFAGAGPLFSRFTANTAKVIETTFSGNTALLKQKSAAIGGTIVQTADYDICVRFRALQRIPILLYFNDAEDGMPASASFLFHDNIERYLDIDCISVLTTYLTGRLIDPAIV